MMIRSSDAFFKSKAAFQRSAAKGFSMLEMLLALAVFVVLMTSIVGVMRNYSEREIARSTTNYMSSVMEAMVDILNTPASFMALYHAASNNAGGYQMVADANVNDPARNILQDMLINAGPMGNIRIPRTSHLNENFRHFVPVRSTAAILLRVANAPGTPPALDVLVVTRTPRPFDLVQKTANEAGFMGGYIPNYSNKAAAVIRNGFNSWSITPSSGLSSTSWFINDLPATLNIQRDGSFAAFYHYANYAAITSDYLFRTRDPNPGLELNTMFTPLNLNGHNVLGADDVDINGAPFAAGEGYGDECEGSVLCVNGTTIVKGSAMANGIMTVSGNALVEDSLRTVNARIENALMDDTARLNYAAQGHLVVGRGSTGGGSAVCNGSALAGNRVCVETNALFEDGTVVDAGQMENIQALEVNLPGGAELHTGTIGDAWHISASTVHAARMVSQGPVNAGVVGGGAASFTSSNPAATTGTIEINNMQGNLQIGGAGAGNARRLQVQRLQVNTLSISEFGACNDCPK